MCLYDVKRKKKYAKTFTRKQVEESRNLGIVGNKVLDLQSFSKIHPGGDMFPSFFASRDATIAFATYHGRTWSDLYAADFIVGVLSDADVPIVMDECYMELFREVRKLLGSRRGFAPPIYFMKVAIILVAAVYIEFICFTGARNFFLSTLLGLLFAWVGLNVMHDSNHGSVSKNPRVNRVLGMTQDWIGGSSVLWIHQHVVQHHVYTNHEEHDPDIQGFPLFRLYANSEWHPHHRLQHVYLFAALTLFGIRVAILDFFQLKRKEWSGSKLSALVDGYWLSSYIMKFMFYVRFILLPLYFSDNRVYTLLYIFWTTVVCGAYLSFFFMLSHNFAGARTYARNDNLAQGSVTYLESVVETSCNVGGEFLCAINGGLNYQIEHHLFPRIHHSYYPKIAPLVSEFCKKKNLPYTHYGSIADNVRSMRKHLKLLGEN